ncbi:thialysine N-epsilon-acetyltransferase isoform X1 [Plutella xylostella]|uniref:thialysine N-epsilon-acetyltransferase isoform X1 n=1 Tax=Plutella xylostella TaxID=51655 RepID=UPI0020328BFD|nr:thialysine N-epsilon-acetyltransferase isoform X1 [Plutella xylostella]
MSESEKYTDDEICVRPAKKEDMKAVAEMIQELADFEKMPDGPKMSLKELERDGFELQPPAFRCCVAELAAGSGGARAGAGGGVLAGYVLYFPTYSTWEGRALLLEDLYVRPAQRRRGVGERLFNHVAKEAARSGCSRLDFHVLEWNPATDFYQRKGAENLTAKEQWCYYRLSGAALAAAAAGAPGVGAPGLHA